MRTTPSVVAILILAAALILSGCSNAAQHDIPADDVITKPTAPTPTEEVYHFNQLLDRDAIRPVYDPQFLPASEANLADEQLVLGVAMDGEAKAYPIAVLNSREMVNDDLAGIPILATW